MPFYFFTENINEGLNDWQTKMDLLEGGATSIYDIAIIGDSITDGGMAAYKSPTDYGNTNTTELMQRSYVGLLRSYYKHKYGDVGLGRIPAGHPVSTHAYVTYDENWSLTYLKGVNLESMRSTTTGSTVTFTFYGTGLELQFIQHEEGGAVNIIVDETTTPYSTEGIDHTLQTITIPDLENTSHTCTITLTENKYVYFAGFTEQKGNKGVRIHLLCRGGATGATANTTELNQCMEHIQPDLTIISLGCNDAQQQLSLTSFETNLRALIAKGEESGEVLVTTIGSNAAATPILYFNYGDVIRSVVEELGVAFVDVDQSWGGGSGGISKGFLISGNVHPIPKGHRNIFKALRSVLVPWVFSVRSFK